MSAGQTPTQPDTVGAGSSRATRALIDLDALANNVGVFVERAGQGAGVMAVVKANAYGHGAVMVARAAVEAGASWLAVATVDEGCQLRAAGLDRANPRPGPQPPRRSACSGARGPDPGGGRSDAGSDGCGGGGRSPGAGPRRESTPG